MPKLLSAPTVAFCLLPSSNHSLFDGSEATVVILTSYTTLPVHLFATGLAFAMADATLHDESRRSHYSSPGRRYTSS